MSSRTPDATDPHALRGALDHERHCCQLLDETKKFRDLLRTADLAAKVPTCPEWTLADLTGDRPAHRRAHEKAAVALCAPPPSS
jgi:hypothetical protein